MAAARPLDFTDCLIDGPQFRENLSLHERQIADTKKAVGSIVDQCRNIITCNQALSNAYKDLAVSLYNLGSGENEAAPVDGETGQFLKDIGVLILKIEDERQQMPNRLEEAFLKPLKRVFATKDLQEEGRMKSESAKVNKPAVENPVHQEKYVHVERNAELQSSVEYVQKLRIFQESKRFEFLDALVCLVNHQMNFYHLGYEIVSNFKPLRHMNEKLQTMRADIAQMTKEVDEEKQIILKNPTEYLRTSFHKSSSTVAGYLLVMKKFFFGTVWLNFFCEFRKDTRYLHVTAPPNQFASISNDTMDNGRSVAFIVKTCSPLREGNENNSNNNNSNNNKCRPFCFEVSLESLSSGKQLSLVMQAQDDADRLLWVEAMNANKTQDEPIKIADGLVCEVRNFESAVRFLTACIKTIERDHLTTTGLYRIPGLKGNVLDLLRRCFVKEDAPIDDILAKCNDVKSLTGAIQVFLSSLSEPLLTFDLYDSFLYAASLETRELRKASIHYLVKRLPTKNFHFLNLLIVHLAKVSANSDTNKMTSLNLGVCFGPTLLRPRHNSLRIENVKLCNSVVEILIENANEIFESDPPVADVDALSASWVMSRKTPSGLSTVSTARLTQNYFTSILASWTTPRKHVLVADGSSSSNKNRPSAGKQSLSATYSFPLATTSAINGGGDRRMNNHNNNIEIDSLSTAADDGGRGFTMKLLGDRLDTASLSSLLDAPSGFNSSATTPISQQPPRQPAYSPS